jgi:hypothetical protein
MKLQTSLLLLLCIGISVIFYKTVAGQDIDEPVTLEMLIEAVDKTGKSVCFERGNKAYCVMRMD